MGLAPDDRLEQVLGGHLREELEGQRGRAGAAFRARVVAEAAARRRRMWFAAAMPLAAAACALVVCYPLMRGGPGGEVVKPGPGGGGVATTIKSIPDGANVLDDLTLTRNVDEGTIVMEDHTPARVLRELRLRHTQWYDPQEKAMMSVTRPEEKVKFVALQPY